MIGREKKKEKKEKEIGLTSSHNYRVHAVNTTRRRPETDWRQLTRPGADCRQLNRPETD
jgi:hypothetical protein